MQGTDRNYKNTEIDVEPDSFSGKSEEFEDGSRLGSQPTASKLPNEDLFNNKHTDSDMFLKDPLF